jgi:SPP1 gp7 family putative phage head morphogenesis protein
VAKQVGAIVKGLAPGGYVTDIGPITRALTAYGELIAPWAMNVARYMIADVSRRNEKVWFQVSKEMGSELRREIQNAPTGAVFQQLQNEQVKLIKSLPLEAAKRVHELTQKGLSDSTRASEIAKEILRTGEVTESRARLIARTEVSRAASNLTQARARFAGSSHYVWRTSEDFDVRESHAAMDGKVVAWDSPPTLDGLTGHAGTLPNCRCFPIPLLPNDFDD